jgi:hypothetical protein
LTKVDSYIICRPDEPRRKRMSRCSSLDLDESVMSGLEDQPLPPVASLLDHLSLGQGPVVDASPFLNSLRQAYREQFARTVANAVALHCTQMTTLETNWPPASSFLIDDEIGC